MEQASPKQRRQRGLVRRLNVSFALLLLLLIVAQTFTVLWMFLRVADISEQRLLRPVACKLSGLLEPYLTPTPNYSELASKIDTIRAANPKLRLFFLSKDGKVLGSFDAQFPALLEELPSVDVTEIQRFVEEGATAQYPIYGPDPEEASKGTLLFSACPIRIAGEEGYLYLVLLSRFARSVYFMSAQNVGVVSGVLLLLVSVLLAAVLGARILAYLNRRLQELLEVVERFGKNDFSLRAPVNHQDELTVLARTVNSMADAIEDNLHQLEQRDVIRRELIADVSHDLRGPVSGIKGYLHILEMAPESERLKRFDDIIAGLFRSSNALESLLQDLFELAKLEAKAKDPHFVSVNVIELARDAIARARGIAEKKGVGMQADFFADPVLVSVDESLMSRALANLLENAIHYTEAPGNVHLEVTGSDTEITISVRDEGVGIPEEEIEKIFGRFSQGSSSRFSSGASSGLGLAIVQRVVELHGSRIEVASTVGLGSTFYFSLRRRD